MSGPKVVRIVTRDEVLSICAGLLARVVSALADWERIGLKNECVSAEEIAASRARIGALQSLMTTDRFLEVQKRAPQEIVSLQQDMQARLTRKADEASARRLMTRRRAEAVTALLHAASAKGKSVPAELRMRLDAADKGIVERAMTEAFGLLVDIPQGTSDRKRSLAARLRDEQPSTSLSDWLATQPTFSSDEGLQRVERQISELATLGSEAVASFEARVQHAEQELGTRRGLLIDSIHLDLSRELNLQREKTSLDREILAAFAELKSLNAEIGPLSRPETMTIADRQTLLTSILADIEAHRQRMAAGARRAAILKSLAGLGYEVTEGLETAWVDNGRIVVRKAAPPGYGVEIAGAPDLDRMQMRVVAFEGEAPLDEARDRDAETLWCGDVAELEHNLAREGGALLIDRAMPIGAVAVKRVAGRAPVDVQEVRQGRPTQTRTLR